MQGRITRSEFQTPWWLSSPHAQTLWPKFTTPGISAALTRERLELEDGDFLDLCWVGGDSGPLVIVFHGLEGSIESHYAMNVMNCIHERGWRGVFVHFRGCSGEYNRLKRNYHSGETGDIALVIGEMHRRYPGVPLAAVAYSLGGNALLKFLGEASPSNHLACAVCVSVPFLLDNGARRLEKGFSRIYQHYLIGRLHRKMKEKYAGEKFGVKTAGIEKMNTFRLLDDAYTAPIHGFDGVDDYYQRCSSRQFMKHITTPTLVIHAEDDPFLTPGAIPAENELGSGVTLELSKGGGHVGFIEGKYPWAASNWLSRRIPEFLDGYMET